MPLRLPAPRALLAPLASRPLPALPALPALLLALALAGAAHAQGLPAEVQAALKRAGVPEQSMSAVLLDAASGRNLLSWEAEVPRNPASLAKLLTTTAALERLGPAWTWSTPVWLAGPVKDGVLEGALHIKGSGDPRLVLERVWLLLRRVQQLGVREIRGDIVLDQSAFAVPDVPPGEFDGEVLRPYNVKPAALLLNYRSVLYSFVPDAGAGVARVLVEPTLARTAFDRTVPLSAAPCEDWRGALRASFAEARTRFAGSYATACGESLWPVADPQPASYDARLLEGLWREMGGTLTGRVREGAAPTDLKPSFEHRSPALAEVVRDINKFSNNVMAELLFLTLAAQHAAPPGAAATPEAARAWLRRWWGERLGSGDPGDELVIHNGSGLSRENRLSARALARLLQTAYASPVMPELMASLPVTGADGTLRRVKVAPGRAHLKTGSLRDVAGIAGYVLASNGRRFVLVAMINHPNANAARPALEALTQWALNPRDPSAARNPQPP